MIDEIDESQEGFVSSTPISFQHPVRRVKYIRRSITQIAEIMIAIRGLRGGSRGLVRGGSGSCLSWYSAMDAAAVRVIDRLTICTPIRGYSPIAYCLPFDLLID